jgi:hypothetical protein
VRFMLVVVPKLVWNVYRSTYCFKKILDSFLLIGLLKCWSRTIPSIGSIQ